MSRYPHVYDHHRGALRVCACGDTWHSEYGDEPQGDDCPAALRKRAEELERHVGSLHKATAAGMEHERAAVVAFLRYHLGESSTYAAAISRGAHHEGAPDAS